MRCRARTSSRAWQLAVEHINSGHELIKKISPKITKGVLGKEVKLRRRRQRRQAEPGGAGAAALHHREQDRADDRFDLFRGRGRAQQVREREKVLYVAGISGSNDTTGKDCVRYGFRQNFYGETAANAIGPILVKHFGKDSKAAFMTPDYTYGHTVTKSMNDYLTKNGNWTMVTNQVSPLGTQDFSQYLPTSPIPAPSSWST